MRSSHPKSNEWIHYEASEAALRRASNALNVALANIEAFVREQPEVKHLPLYAELMSELQTLVQVVLRRVSEHSKRMDTLEAANRLAETAHHLRLAEESAERKNGEGKNGEGKNVEESALPPLSAVSLVIIEQINE